MTNYGKGKKPVNEISVKFFLDILKFLENGGSIETMDFEHVYKMINKEIKEDVQPRK